MPPPEIHTPKRSPHRSNTLQKIKNCSLYLMATATLTSCGVIKYKDSNVSADLIAGTRNVNGVQTNIELIADDFTDKTGNILLYAWSPVVVVQHGKVFELQLELKRANAPIGTRVKVDSVKLISPPTKSQTISLSSGSDWTTLSTEALLLKSTKFFPIPDDGDSYLQINISTQLPRGAAKTATQRWQLKKATESSTHVGFKSA